MAGTRSLVTGANGFIASHLVEQLLERGDQVNTTVRSRTNAQKIQHLMQLQKEYPGKLHLFEADLLTTGSFDEATKGCSVVYHVASPFILPEHIKDGQKEVVEPALRGTQNVLDAVERTESIKTVVLTSTIGAIAGDYADVLKMKDQVMTEEYFNSSSTVNHNAYHYAKVLAEKEAWERYDMQAKRHRWRLVVINPGLVLGPSRSPYSESGSLALLHELLKGDLFFGVPDLYFTTVDVREVVQAHIAAATNVKAHGRYILAHQDKAAFLDVSKILKELKQSWSLPEHKIPSWIVFLLGPLVGLEWKWLRLNLGIQFKVDNHRSIEELGIVYRPLKETLRDHYQSWLQTSSAK